MDEARKLRRCIAAELIFGTAYAVFLTKTKLGRYLADDQTWVSVVIGVAGTVLIGAPVLGWQMVTRLMALFAGSGTPIITRSLLLDMNAKSFWAGLKEAIGGDDRKHELTRSEAVAQLGH